jgi:hypothetical protein
MASRIRILYFLPLLISLICNGILAQTVPAGIHYQAVARDASGKELSDKLIGVKFSVISGNPDGPVEYKEIYENIRTTKYGVFSLVIGKGDYVEGTASDFSKIVWESSNHWLKVEVKFDNNYIDMGTIQFLAVPYALYAKKSLEPGPQGPKGDPGDPATDNQTLSFNGSNLSISGSPGNTVNLSTLSVPHQLNIFGDTLSVFGGNRITLPNEIQDLNLINDTLRITKNALPTKIDMGVYRQNLLYNNTTGILSISNGTGADLSVLKTDEIQDLILDVNNKLKITKNASATEFDLSKFMDNTDNQALSFNSATNTLSLTNGGTVNLGIVIAFRAKKLLSTVASSMTDVTFIPGTIEYNDGNAFNETTGGFVAPITGVYTFSINYYADGTGSARKLIIYYNSGIYEEIAVEIAAGTLTTRSITMKLNVSDVVKLVINTGTSTQTGTGTFSGFRVY